MSLLPSSEPLDLAGLPARQRLLLTAHRLFYRDGIRATGIDRVIAEAGVTKVTFYRHFPGKNDLVLAYLGYRHEQWMAWFDQALQHHCGRRSTNAVQALLPALREWFADGAFRGCAFLNAAVELGATVAGVRELACAHKQHMTRSIAGLLPAGARRDQQAHLLGIAVDGAIVRVQAGEPVDAALDDLARLLELLRAAG